MFGAHEPVTRLDPDGGQVAYCPKCDRDLFGPSGDTETIQMYLDAHTRVTRDSRAAANEALAAARDVASGKMSEAYYDIVVAERSSWRSLRNQ